MLRSIRSPRIHSWGVSLRFLLAGAEQHDIHSVAFLSQCHHARAVAVVVHECDVGIGIDRYAMNGMMREVLLAPEAGTQAMRVPRVHLA